MGSVATHSMIDSHRCINSSISSIRNKPSKTPNLFLVRLIHMLLTVAIRITLRYGTLASKQIKVNKIKAFKVLLAPDECYVMLCCEFVMMRIACDIVHVMSWNECDVHAATESNSNGPYNKLTL